MKIQCEIIRDLIPLMEDDVCSEQSKKAVFEHIKYCKECRELYETAKINPRFVLNTEETAAKEIFDKGFKKIKRRWLASVFVVLFVIPVFYLSWGQYCGRGFSFTNINEYVISRAFLNDLVKEDYEAAFQHLNLQPMKDRWISDWFEEEKLENIEKDAMRVFCESATLLKEVGGIKNPKLLAVDEQPDHFVIYYTIEVNGKEEEFSIDVTDRGVVGFYGDGRFIDDPVARFGAWSEFLWQEYKGCYFDINTKQYVF